MNHHGNPKTHKKNKNIMSCIYEWTLLYKMAA